jgi:hypothetical protein
MPTEVRGVIALRKALNAYAPDLAKELTAEITQSLKVIQKSARGFVPASAPGGLYNWDKAAVSEPKTFNTSGRVRPFPRYDATLIKRGIVYRTGYGKPNSKGFRSLFRVKNMSAAGSIYETAGRLSGQQRTPQGERFIQQGPLYGSKKAGQDMRGRVLYRAWEQDQGKQLTAIFKAIEKADKEFKKRTANGSIKGAA